MPSVRLRPKSGGLGERLSYRLDRFLALHPVVQLAAVLVWATLLALVFGLVSLAFSEDAGAGLVHGLWWAITHMLDGGAVAGDKGPAHRVVGVGVTLAGTLLVALITGAFASSFVARLRDVRRGTFTVFERKHIVFLGYGARADLLLRELAVSGLRVTVVIVTPREREVVDERVREALNGTKHHLRVVVRRADPGSTAGVRGASAAEARALVILPEIEPGSLPSAGHDAAEHAPEDRAAMRSVLAARRVLGAARTPVIVEITGDRGRELVDLCSKPADLTLVDEGDLAAHLLVHAVRQSGVLDVVRQILSLDARSVYIHTPGAFVGKTFDQAHAALGPGVLLGLLRHRTNLLSPPGHLTLEASDRLLVLANDACEPCPCAPLVVHERTAPASSRSWMTPLHVLVIGYRRGFATLLRALHTHFVAKITVLVPPERAASARAALDASGFRPEDIELIEGRPTDAGALARAAEHRPSRLFLLASDAAPERAGEVDADQILTLLQLRRLLPGSSADPPAVVEIHSADTESLVEANRSTEFVLVREITGMLVGQELHAICLDGTAGAWLGDVLRMLLVEICTRVWLRPLGAYVSGKGEPSFAEIASAARARGETAIGVRRARGLAHLLPGREERFDPRDTDVIVVAPPEPAHAHAHPHAPEVKRAEATV